MFLLRIISQTEKVFSGRYKAGRVYSLVLPPRLIFSKQNSFNALTAKVIKYSELATKIAFKDFKPFIQDEFLNRFYALIDEFVANLFHHTNSHDDRPMKIRWGYKLNLDPTKQPEFYIYLKSNDLKLSTLELEALFSNHDHQTAEDVANLMQTSGRGLWILKNSFDNASFTIQTGNYGEFNSMMIFSFLIPKEFLIKDQF